MTKHINYVTKFNIISPYGNVNLNIDNYYNPIKEHDTNISNFFTFNNKYYKQNPIISSFLKDNNKKTDNFEFICSNNLSIADIINIIITNGVLYDSTLEFNHKSRFSGPVNKLMYNNDYKYKKLEWLNLYKDYLYNEINKLNDDNSFKQYMEYELSITNEEINNVEVEISPLLDIESELIQQAPSLESIPPETPLTSPKLLKIPLLPKDIQPLIISPTISQEIEPQTPHAAGITQLN